MQAVSDNEAPSTRSSSSSIGLSVTPKRSLINIFNDVISWPEPKSATNKRKQEYTPSVVTSDKWVEYFELKEKEKKDKEIRIEQRRKELELKKVKFQQNRPKNKTRQIISDSTSSEEETTASGDSGDEHSLVEDKEPTFFSVDQIKPGDFILTKFQSCGKGTSAAVGHNYRYVRCLHVCLHIIIKPNRMAVKFNNICRLCMVGSADKLLPIFHMEGNLPGKLTALVPSIKMCAGDGLPEQVCSTCVHQVITSYNFKLQCENVDVQLRTLLACQDTDSNNQMPERNSENGNSLLTEVKVEENTDPEISLEHDVDNDFKNEER
ncbi:hypothetical protein C0J52_03227 [Blattella germanica]|nr:hypothetical protein C0J52_03227 [Blattella germanica]